MSWGFKRDVYNACNYLYVCRNIPHPLPLPPFPVCPILCYPSLFSQTSMSDLSSLLIAEELSFGRRVVFSSLTAQPQARPPSECCLSSQQQGWWQRYVNGRGTNPKRSRYEANSGENSTWSLIQQITACCVQRISRPFQNCKHSVHPYTLLPTVAHSGGGQDTQYDGHRVDSHPSNACMACSFL